MRYFYNIAILGFLFCSCASAQEKNDIKVGGPFENSDYMYQGMPSQLNNVDTSIGWHDQSSRLIIGLLLSHR